MGVLDDIGKNAKKATDEYILKQKKEIAIKKAKNEKDKPKNDAV